MYKSFSRVFGTLIYPADFVCVCVCVSTCMCVCACRWIFVNSCGIRFRKLTESRPPTRVCLSRVLQSQITHFGVSSIPHVEPFPKHTTHRSFNCFCFFISSRHFFANSLFFDIPGSCGLGYDFVFGWFYVVVQYVRGLVKFVQFIAVVGTLGEEKVLLTASRPQQMSHNTIRVTIR